VYRVDEKTVDKINNFSRTGISFLFAKKRKQTILRCPTKEIKIYSQKFEAMFPIYNTGIEGTGTGQRKHRHINEEPRRSGFN
jgi:hypothetical protein